MRFAYKISLIIGLLIVVAFGIFLSWKKLLSPLNPNPTTPPPEPNQPNNTNKDINSLSDNAVFDFWITPDNGEVYYITPEGKIFSAKDGPDIEISKQTINALNFVEVSPNNQFVLAAFADPKMPQWGIFDLIDKVWRPLPQEIVNATWDTGQNLIGTVKNQNNLNLSLINVSSNPISYKTIISDFRLKDVRLKVLDNQLIIAEKASAYYPTRVWQINLGDLAFNSLFAPEKGLSLNWSTDKNILFKFASPDKFYIYNNKTLTQLTPKLFTTLPQKCDGQFYTTSTVLIYCFVPNQTDFPAILPDDYLQKKLFTADQLFFLRFNTETNKIEKYENVFLKLSFSAQTIDGKNIKINGDKLFFINNYDSRLYVRGKP